jgi:hypothetical protein
MRFLSHRRAFVSFALAAALLAMMLGRPVTAWAQVEVNTCGQSVSGRAVLTGDLDCTGFAGHAVIVESGRLDLNGFTITGGNFYGVACFKSCKIVGPGTIKGSQRQGVTAAGKATIRDVAITGNGQEGVEAGSVEIRDSTITGNGYSGIRADRSVKVRDSVITGNAYSGAVVGVLDYIGHGMFECRKGRMSIGDSTITGNGLGADCGVSWACADLESCPKAPKLRGAVTCDTSLVNGSGLPGESWNICTLD